MSNTRTVIATAIAATTILMTTGGSASAAPTTTETVRDGIRLLSERTPVTVKAAKGKGPTRADFDGDGRDDVAVFSYAGVAVTYSSTAYREVLRTEIPGHPGSELGRSMAVGDFNADGYDDLAIGDYTEPDLRNMGYQAGGVWVVPGGSGGLRISGAKHFSQSTAGIPGASADSDWFGASLAAGDITGDGRDDLAIGIPLKTIGKQESAGAVVVLKGGAGGVTATGARWISQSTAGVPGASRGGDEFGSSVAIGRIDKNRYQDLVVGAPGKAPDGGFGNGTITQFWGSASGVSLKKVTALSGGHVVRTRNLDNLSLWSFGADLAVGDVTGDGYGEVVSGVGAQVGRHSAAGAVISIPGRSTGLSAKGAIVITQNSAGVAGAAEEGDSFGGSIAIGDVTRDGRADVLAGIPGENNGAGAVVLLRGSAKGLTGAKSQTLSQASAGVPDSPERDDQFGTAVALLNLDGGGGLDALVGSPGEVHSGDRPGLGSGSVTRFLGGSSGLGSATVTSGRFLTHDFRVSYGGYVAR
ncbi:FG-GAP-like repeat-containing protein [Actinoplanes sp. G11-F43]|uniref:FG-GAP-like repeat-containing protein n=1 Tax=Actinoplanes sp. G11-F43 TaxID=3424130 RepID=UPI003D33C110